MNPTPVTLDAIRAARERIRDVIYHSPCPYSLSRFCGAEIYCKLDHLQMTGSFKERGARNKLLLLSEDERKSGVVAASAGNHALALDFNHPRNARRRACRAGQGRAARRRHRVRHGIIHVCPVASIHMSELERAAAKMFCVGFDGTSVTPSVRRLIKRGVSGVVLFGRNVESAEQVAALCAELKAIAGRPLLVCVDQEGGRVMRLREGFTIVPSMRAVGQANDIELARGVGRLLGRELRAVSIDVDFAPCLDVDTNPNNPVIAHRSFGADPDLVARLGCAVIEGMQAQGVAACGKHFPGHGDTSQDSHLHLPRLPHSMDRLSRVELPPFAAAVRAGVAMIMTAHVIFEPIDDKFPATMSRPVLDGVLRQQLGFTGVIVSDALEMKAIAANFPVEEVVTRGALAGVDLFSPCEESDLRDRAIDALIKSVERGDIPRARLDESGRRIDALSARYTKLPATADVRSVLGCREHREIVEKILAKSADRSEGAPDPTAHRLV